MKKLLRILLLSAILCVGLTTVASAETWMPDETAEYKLSYDVKDDGTVEIRGGSLAINTPSDQTVVIPESIDGKPVTSIGPSAFYNCEWFTGGLELPETLTSIANDAFQYSSFTGGLVIPDSVTSIGNNAFSNCSGLTSLKLSKNLTSLGTYAFYYCSGMTGDLTIPGGLKEIPSNAFYKATFDGSLVLEEGVERTGENAFAYNSFADTLTLPSTLTFIGKQSFSGCPFSGELVLPEGLNTIEKYAFSYGGFSGDLVIPDGITSIEDSTFSECDFDGDLVLPKGLTSIGSYAFASCKFTGDVVIPDSVTSIRSSIFNGCTGKDLTLGTGVTEIPEKAFQSIKFTGSLTLPEGITSIGSSGFSGCKFTGDLVLPDSLLTIGSYCFSGAAFDGTLVIGENLSSAGSQVFYNVPFTNLVIRDISAPVFDSTNFANSSMVGDLTILKGDIRDSMFSQKGYFKGTLNLGEGVTSIGQKAFYSCNFSSLVASEGLTSIGDQAFYQCQKLTTLTLPSSLQSIGANAFYNCTGLTGELVIPDNVISIGEYAFYACKGITSLHLGSSLRAIEADAFINCSGLKGTLTIPDSVYALGDGAFANCTGLTGLHLGDELLVISSRCFKGCTGMTGGLAIPDSVRTLGEGAFLGCTGFTSLRLGEGLTSIQDNVFSGCTGFRGTLTIPDSVTELGTYGTISTSGADGVFLNCTGFTRLVLGSGLQTIGCNAFKGCTGFTGNLAIPDSVVGIGYQAFYNCTGFNGTLTLGESVATIASSAFSGCSGFQGDLILPGRLTELGANAFAGCNSFTGDLVCPSSLTSFYLDNLPRHITQLFLPDTLTAVKTMPSLYNNCYFEDLTDIYYAGTEEQAQAITGVGKITNLNNAVWHYDYSKLPESVTLSGRSTVQKGKSVTFIAKVLPATATDKSVTWSSSNPSVATVSGGVVTGVKEGTATITATTVNGLTASRVISVKNNICEVLVYGHTMEDPFTYYPLENASVNIQGISRLTGEDGVAVFESYELPSGGYATASVSCDGYFTATGTVLFVGGFDNTFYLMSKGNNICFTSSNLRIGGKTLDLLNSTSTHYIPLLDDKTSEVSTATYPISVAVDWNNYAKGTVILKGMESGNEVTLQDGVTKAVAFAQTFDAREPLKLIATTKDDEGNKITAERIIPVEVALNATIVIPPTEPEDSDDIYLLTDGSTEEKEDDTPKNGIKVKLNLGEVGKLASNVSFKDGVLTLTYSGTDKEQTKFDMFDGIASGKSGPSVSLSGTIKIPLTDPYGGEWSGSIKVTLADKANAKVASDSDAPTNEEGKKIPQTVTVPLFRHRFAFLTAGVPCYVDTAVSAGGSGELKIHGPYDDIYFTGKLEATSEFSAEGGVGGGIGGADGDNVALKLGIKGSLKGTLPVEYTATSLKDSTFSFDPSITGTVSGKATLELMVISFEGEVKLGQVKWDKNGITWSSDLVDDASLFSTDENWAFVGRDYLENGGGFTSQVVLLGLEDAARIPVTVYQNIIPCADAVLTIIDGTPYLFFTMDDKDHQDDYNNLRLACSAWNGSSWSDPVWVSDDITADYAADADGAFVAWEDSNTTLTAETTAEEMLAATGITAGVFDGDNFTVTHLTEDELYDHSVKVRSANGKAMAAWLTNDAASLTGAQGTTSIRYSVYDGSEWSKAAVLAEDVGAVTNLNLTYDGATGTIYYKDSSNAFYTISTGGTSPVLAEDTMGRYCVAMAGDQELLARFDVEGALHISRNGVEKACFDTEYTGGENPVITASATSAAIFWIEHGGIYYTVDLGDGWSGRLCLKSDSALLSGLSCQLLDSENYVVSYFRTENDITDLVTLFASAGADLALMNVTADEEAYLDSGTVEYELSVFNNGEKAAESVTVTVYDDETETAVHTKTFDVTVQPGETVGIPDSFVPTDGSAIHDYTVEVSLEGDCNSGNNQGWFSVGSLDAEILDANFTGGALQVILRNNGNVPISGTLRLFENSLDTEPTHETEVSDLPGGSMQVISIDQAREGDTVYYLQLDAEDEDESNNLYILAYDDSTPALDADLSGSGLLTVTVNTEKVDISNTSVVVAVKEADGRFDRAFVKPLAECGQRDNIAGLTLSLTDLPTSGKVQVLAVDQTTWAPVTEGLWV